MERLQFHHLNQYKGKLNRRNSEYEKNAVWLTEAASVHIIDEDECGVGFGGVGGGGGFAFISIDFHSFEVRDITTGFIKFQVGRTVN